MSRRQSRFATPAAYLAPALLAIAGALAPQLGHAVSNPDPGSNTPVPGTGASIRMINQMARVMPPVSAGVAADATAMCADGSISRNRDALSACMYRGGIQRWYGAPADRGMDLEGTVIASSRG
jgi:hypothetical protein